MTDIIKSVETDKVKQLSPELQKLNEVRIDFERYCEVNLKIKTEAGEIVPLSFNKIQKVIIERVLDDITNGRPVRYIVLKARKEGVSTLVEALIYWWTATHKNVKSKIVAHDQDTAEELYAMFRRYYENSNPLFKPTTKYNTRSDLTFDNDDGTGLKSQIDVASAKNTGTGRGQTIQCMHGCIGEDSKIIMSGGYTKKIKDIEIGDNVIAEDGGITTVTNKWVTGEKDILRIKLYLSNEYIDVSTDHKIRVAKIGYNNKLSTPEWKKAKDLTTEDYVLWAYPKTSGVIKFLTIPKLTNSVHIKSDGDYTFGNVTTKNLVLKTDYKLGYLFGYYLAEGHIKKDLSSVNFTCHPDEYFYKKFIDLIPLEPNIRVTSNESGTRKIITYYSKELATFIHSYVGRVVDKCVPDKFLYQMPKDFQRGIYDGWKDGDGSKTQLDRTSITSIHEKIARQMKQIFININHKVPSLAYRENRYRYGIKTKPVYILSEFNRKNKKLCKYKYTIPRGISTKNGFAYIKVKSIDKLDKQITYEIEVAHKSHAFLTVAGVVSNSEVSKWQDGSELMAGLMQAVPKIPNTMIFLESTANGIGDFFHKTWQAAKAGNSVFKPLFFSWADREDYRLPVPPNFKLTDEEKKLKIEYSLDDEQIAWRRETMKEFADDERKFYQEYPLTDIEAFLSSGNSRFNISALVKMDEKCYEPKTYELIEKEEKDGKIQFGKIQKEFKLIEVIGAPLKIWKEPVAAKKYVIGADVAEGIGGDFSVATIMDVDTTETVARWRGDAEPAEFGEILEQLGRYYNNALIACEINNHGLTTVQRIRDMHYSNLYRREKGVDERFEEFTSKLGWKTDRKTKKLMINALSEAIYTGQLQDYDHNFIRECMEYVVDDRGRTNAQLGAHDDTVISTAIALQVFDWTEIRVTSKQIPSRIPQKYAEIRKKHAGMMKTGAKIR